MLPNMKAPSPDVPAGSPQPQSPSPAMAGDQTDPSKVKQSIMLVLTKIKALADQHGIDFGQIVSDMMAGGSPSNTGTPPPPPMPPQAPM